MPYAATVINVLIASPSDLSVERELIRDTIHSWNALHARDQSKVLLPIMWESHSAPQMGDRPQGIINNQVLRGCDMLIGAFWHRLGSPTGKEDSGTVEEIKWFLKQKKPVMLYFSKAPVALDDTDSLQVEALRKFRAEIRNQGIQESYTSADELRMKLRDQLLIVVRELSLGASIDSSTVRLANKASETLEVEKAEKQGATEVFLEEYTDRSFIVRGTTIDMKDRMAAMNGKWIPLKTGGKAWMFGKRRLKEVAKALQVAETLKPGRST